MSTEGLSTHRALDRRLVTLVTRPSCAEVLYAPSVSTKHYHITREALDIQGGAKNGATGQPISLQIFRKLHDRITWKLVDFCNAEHSH